MFQVQSKIRRIIENIQYKYNICLKIVIKQGMAKIQEVGFATTTLHKSKLI